MIFDQFKGQFISSVSQLLSDNHIQIAVVSANLTDRLQPLDIRVNKSVKELLCKEFSLWHSDQMCRKLKFPAGDSPNLLMTETVDLSLSVLKTLGVKWLVSVYKYFKGNMNNIINGFTKEGILHKNRNQQ